MAKPLPILNKMKRLTSLFFTLTIAYTGFTQTDSTTLLSPKDFYNLVLKYHPVVQQAKLKPVAGNFNLLKARGGFDPKIYSDVDQKVFNEKQYYSLINSGMKVPTWFGLEFKGGYEQNQGYLLNNENSTPNTGLWYAGASITLGQGLFIDERRAVLRQAEIYRNASENEQRILINEVIYNAGKSYWDWFMAYSQVLVFRNALNTAQERFNGVKQSAYLGDRPFIDTLEAGIQVQDRKLSLQQAELDFINRALQLSTYLWFENNVPLELKPNTVPLNDENIVLDPVRIDVYKKELDSLGLNHPILQWSQYKIDILKIDERLKKEKLKPVFNVNYNALTYSTSETSVINNYTINNYKWGLNFSMPVLLRKERGDLNLTRLKIKEAQYELQNKNLEIKNKVLMALNESKTLNDQIKLYTQTVKDYDNLLRSEKRMFDGGESSLFMINAREISYLNAKNKLIELKTKYEKSILTIEYAIGELGLNF